MTTLITHKFERETVYILHAWGNELDIEHMDYHITMIPVT